MPTLESLREDIDKKYQERRKKSTEENAEWLKPFAKVLEAELNALGFKVIKHRIFDDVTFDVKNVNFLVSYNNVKGVIAPNGKNFIADIAEWSIKNVCPSHYGSAKDGKKQIALVRKRLSELTEIFV